MERSKIVYYNSSTREAREEGRGGSWGYWLLEQIEEYCQMIGWTVVVEEEEDDPEEMPLYMQPDQEIEDEPFDIHEEMRKAQALDWGADCNPLEDIRALKREIKRYLEEADNYDWKT